MWCRVWQRQIFWKSCFSLKMRKIGQAQGSLNTWESSVFFLNFFFFLSVWSIMKVYINVILVCLSKFLIYENSGSWDMPKMLLTNQITRFFNQSQDSKIGCISQRNSWNKLAFVVSVQQFSEKWLIRFFWFLAQW